MCDFGNKTNQLVCFSNELTGFPSSGTVIRNV